MTDTIEKLLFVVVGFIFGICANMIVDMWRARQRRTGLLKVMRAEARAFVVTCRSAEKSQLPTATDARHLAELIRERYSKDPERWTACRSRASHDAVAAFYLDCTGLLDAMSRYEEQLQHPKAEERPVMASELFRGIANRTEALLVHLGE